MPISRRKLLAGALAGAAALPSAALLPGPGSPSKPSQQGPVKRPLELQTTPIVVSFAQGERGYYELEKRYFDFAGVNEIGLHLKAAEFAYDANLYWLQFQSFSRTALLIEHIGGISAWRTEVYGHGPDPLVRILGAQVEYLNFVHLKVHGVTGSPQVGLSIESDLHSFTITGLELTQSSAFINGNDGTIVGLSGEAQQGIVIVGQKIRFYGGNSAHPGGNPVGMTFEYGGGHVARDIGFEGHDIDIWIKSGATRTLIDHCSRVGGPLRIRDQGQGTIITATDYVLV